MKAETVQDIREKAKPVFERYGATRPAVFGSYARGEAKSESDVDILVQLPMGSSLFDLVGLQFDLEDVLGRSVDVRTYAGLHPLLKARVEREAIAI